MTNRDFFEAVVNKNLTDEVITHAQGQLNIYVDRENKKAAENGVYVDAILTFLSECEGPQVAKAIGEYANCSSQKATALLKKLMAEGKVDRQQVVDGDRQKFGYFLVG